MPRKPPLPTSPNGGVFRQGEPGTRVALYARCSTADQQSLPDQLGRLREYAWRRGWVIVVEVEEVGSGAKVRPKRDELIRMARRREIDAIAVMRLDRWGRTMADLVTSLDELRALGVVFVAADGSLDFTTPAGRALAGMLAVFAEFEHGLIRERVRAGIAARQAKGLPHGRPRALDGHAAEVARLKAEGRSVAGIARDLGISRDSVRRLLSVGSSDPEFE